MNRMNARNFWVPNGIAEKHGLDRVMGDNQYSKLS